MSTFTNILKTIASDSIHYSDAQTLSNITSLLAEKNKRKDRKWVRNDILKVYEALEPTYYSGPKAQLEELITITDINILPWL